MLNYKGVMNMLWELCYEHEHELCNEHRKLCHEY